MRTNGAFDANKAALFAAQVKANEAGAMNRRKKLCWKCQKNKSTTGGKLILKPGLHMFVCKDCMAATKT